MIIIAQQVGKLSLLLVSALIINGTIVQETHALENEPLAVFQKNKIIKVDRRSLCEKFPQNSKVEIEIVKTVEFTIPARNP